MGNDRTGQVWRDVFDADVFLVVGPPDPDGGGIPCHPVVTLHDPNNPDYAGARGWKREYAKRAWESGASGVRRVA